jgi:hypothetical protein
MTSVTVSLDGWSLGEACDANVLQVSGNNTANCITVKSSHQHKRIIFF